MNPTDNKKIINDKFIPITTYCLILTIQVYKFFFATCVACTKINKVMNYINN